MAEREAPTDSPCIGVCQLDTQSVCIGCARSIDEIMQWPRADPARRREILDRVRARRAARPEAFEPIR